MTTWDDKSFADVQTTCTSLGVLVEQLKDLLSAGDDAEPARVRALMEVISDGALAGAMAASWAE